MTCKEMAGELGGEGVQFTEFEMLKTSGLGDKSLGMRMVMDTSAMAAEATEGLDAFKNGMAIDMYVFVKGERGYHARQRVAGRPACERRWAGSGKENVLASGIEDEHQYDRDGAAGRPPRRILGRPDVAVFTSRRRLSSGQSRLRFDMPPRTLP